MHLKTILFLALLLPISIFGQLDNSDCCEKRHIETTGTAERLVQPNEIILELTLKERLKGKSSESIEEQKKSLIKGLKEIGVNENDIQLKNQISDFRNVIIKDGVLDRVEILVKVKTAVETAKVFQLADELNVSHTHIKSTSHSNMDQIRKEVRIDAIKVAKEKVDYLLEAVGEEAGKPIEITEQNVNYGLTSNVRAEYLTRNVVSQSVGVDKYQVADDINFQKIKVTYTYYVKYEIE